jgi:hypothetical protein
MCRPCAKILGSREDFPTVEVLGEESKGSPSKLD